MADKDFVTWLIEELKIRDWNNSQLARHARVVPSTVSMILSRQKRAGLDFCLGIAKAFNEPPEKVLHLAGHLPPRPSRVIEENEAIDIIRQLPAQARAAALAMLRGLGGKPRATSPAIAENTSTPYDPAASHLPEQLSTAFMELADHLQEDALRYVQALAEEQKREREEREIRRTKEPEEEIKNSRGE